MAKKKDMKKGKKSVEIEMEMPYEPKKPKINDKKIKAMEILLKDEGCGYLSRHEMQTIVDAYKAGKRSKK